MSTMGLQILVPASEYPACRYICSAADSIVSIYKEVAYQQPRFYSDSVLSDLIRNFKSLMGWRAKRI